MFQGIPYAVIIDILCHIVSGIGYSRHAAAHGNACSGKTQHAYVIRSVSERHAFPAPNPGTFQYGLHAVALVAACRYYIREGVVPSGQTAMGQGTADFIVTFTAEQPHHLVDGFVQPVKRADVRADEVQQFDEVFGCPAHAAPVDLVFGNEETVCSVPFNVSLPAADVLCGYGVAVNRLPFNGADASVHCYEAVKLLSLKIVYGAVWPSAANEQLDAPATQSVKGIKR